MSQIDVNIAAKHGACSTEHHDSPECEPICLPCRLPPSFTAEVPLGECISPAACGLFSKTHLPDCPARPIRVTCSITSPDGSWETSEVTDVEKQGAINAYLFQNEAEHDAALNAIRDRWALVKALVTGETPSDPFGRPVVIPPLFLQRDAVFAALADMARAEDALTGAMGRLPLAFRGPALFGVWDRPSVEVFARYVERLIEQVGGMT